MRFRSISPNLAEAFQHAGDREKRRATSLACEIAAKQAGLRGSAVDAALDIPRQGGSDAAMQLEIEVLSGQFDDEYLRLQGRDESTGDSTPEMLVLFRMARAAAALAFALSPASEQLHEALYEAAFASDDQAGVLKSIETALL